KVREFQSHYNLAVSGIADEVTLTKITELLRGINYTEYDLTLNEAVNLQMKVNPQTDQNYAYVAKRYINDNDTVTPSNGLIVRSGPGSNYERIGVLSIGTKVDIIGESGDFYIINYRSSAWVHARTTDVRRYLNPDNF